MILYNFIIIIIIRMTPLLNQHSNIHWEKVVAFYFNIGFHNISFRILKKPQQPEFQVLTFWPRFGLVWVSKTETEPTFGLPHIPNNSSAKRLFQKPTTFKVNEQMSMTTTHCLVY